MGGLYRMKHAKLSASGSHRWLNCPGSIEAESHYPNTTNKYAEEGTMAHEFAEKHLKGDIEELSKFPLDNLKITKEMNDYVDEYISFVNSFKTKKTKLIVEQKVDFSRWVPKGFGTIDAAIIDLDKKEAHIFDLKYGKGIQVFAENNTQAQLYALGLFAEFDFLDDIETFHIHICQPRMYHFDKWTITKNDLLKFGEYVKQRSKLALEPKAERIPGELQCKWCKAKNDCSALFDLTTKAISNDFEDLEQIKNANLSDDQIRFILNNKPLIEDFLQAVEKRIFNFLNNGGKFEGFKLVEGRSTSKWSQGAEEKLKEILGDKAYIQREPSLIGITDCRKLLKKDEIEPLISKEPGSLKLVPDSDKRKAFIPVINDFEDIK